MPFVVVAHPQHPLHELGRTLTLRDLRKYRHLVVRDSGAARSSNVLSLEAVQRWTVSNMSTSIDAVRRGYGFAWFPQDKIREELARGELKPLPLREGGVRMGSLYLVFADRGAAGPGTLRLADLIREAVRKKCVAVNDAGQAAAQAAPHVARQPAPAAARKKKPKM
jgi:DNA-binding transcriptional LysR family regulator